jgi:hypothetical protein
MDIPFFELAALIIFWQFAVWVSRVFGVWMVFQVIKSYTEGRKKGDGKNETSQQG